MYAYVYVCIYVQVCPVRCVVAASNELPGTTIFEYYSCTACLCSALASGELHILRHMGVSEVGTLIVVPSCSMCYMGISDENCTY